MKVWPIFKKEIRLYFASPIGYAILFFFTVAMGFFFWVYFSQYTRMSMQAMMNPMAARDVNVIEWVLRPLFSGFLSIVLLLSLVPAISMRLIAEERKSQTLELLMTYPVTQRSYSASSSLDWRSTAACSRRRWCTSRFFAISRRSSGPLLVPCTAACF